jgi:uncharacterized membrane protein HdeD (DUF308 family)
VVVFANPLAGAISIVYLIAGWAVVIGALKVLFAIRIKSMPGRLGDKFSALG